MFVLSKPPSAAALSDNPAVGRWGDRIWSRATDMVLSELVSLLPEKERGEIIPE